MDDMDVLIGRIEARIKACKCVIKVDKSSTRINAIAENRMEAFQDILKEIEQIKRED